MKQEGAPFETVTKLDAAERQLRVAIRMFFERKDMVAIHTLAAAALQILDDLARKRGNIKRLYGRVYETFPREQADKIMKGIREAQGFFKHADRDPTDKVLKFSPETTPFYLIEAAHLAFALGLRAPEIQAVLAWSVVAYPKFFKLAAEPYLRKLHEELSKTIKPDDFELILYAMDQPARQAKKSSE